MFGASPARGGLLTGLHQFQADPKQKDNNLAIGSLSIGLVKASLCTLMLLCALMLGTHLLSSSRFFDF
jgi:hypothetical protein